MYKNEDIVNIAKAISDDAEFVVEYDTVSLIGFNQPKVDTKYLIQYLVDYNV